MPFTNQNTNNSGSSRGSSRGRGGYSGGNRSRGRGRGRGRGGRGRRYNRKFKNEPVKKKEPVERCPFIVGTHEWCAWKRARFVNNTFHSTYEMTKDVVPRTILVDNSKECYDNKMCNLQVEMIDNKWILKSINDHEYFEHPRYNRMKVDVHTHLTSDGQQYKIPIMNRDDDPLGLACSIAYTAPNNYCFMESNGFTEYNDTRTGHRRQKYLAYLAMRKERREQFEKEAAVFAAANTLNKRMTNKAISSV
jgi:hypothetical protein